MRISVTAILVAHSGGDRLEHTLDALKQQTRRPDRVVAVALGGGDRLAQQLAGGEIESIVSAPGKLAFGEAVQRGLMAVPPGHDAAASAAGETVHEWLWLLTEDSAPEPDALERILATVQRAPSVAVAGPKLLSWDHPDRIIELGQSLTHRGERWVLRRQELDQQQYDHLQDVLGVGPVGMLVHRDVWQQLGGFNPALAVYDDGLDFSVRARLAGYRVVVSPGSRIRFAQSGVAGPRIDRSRHVMRVAHRQARISHLTRRIAYAPAFAAFFMWLGLPLVAIARVLWALIREQPGNMWAEFSSALKVFFTPGLILASRRRIAADNRAGWDSVRPLRVDPKTVRTARMIDREAILASQGRTRREIHFISTGGLAVLIAAAVIALALTWWAITQTSLTGGALAPLSPLGELWNNTRTQGGVPADPFTWVLAVLGTLTFWNPSHAIVLLIVAAIPLAALGGWVWAAQLSESPAARALVGLAWAISPVLLGSIATGRITTLVVVVALPWLLLAASRCRESWSWAGTASILAGIVLAAAPVLIPAAIVLLIVGIASSVRGIGRVLTTAIVPLVLFAPQLFEVVRSRDALALLADPGITPAFTPGTIWHLSLGFPEFGLEGWAGILDGLGLGVAPTTLLIGVLLLPIALLAALGLVTGRVLSTVLNALMAGIGLFTAIASGQIRLVAEGSVTVGIWTGSGIALYWIGILGLAAIGCTVLRRAATPLVAVALVLAVVAVAPTATKLVTNQVPLRDGSTQMPGIVQAAGAQNPQMRTLIITAEGQGAVRAQLVDGSGLRLDDIRTAERTSTTTAEDEWVGELVGELASTGSQTDIAADLSSHAVEFVILRNSASGGASNGASNGASPGASANASGTAGAAGAAGDTERAQLQAAFDQNTALTNAGQTDTGLVWRLNAGATDGADGDDAAEGAAAGDAAAAPADDAAATPADDSDSTESVLMGSSISGITIWWIQLIVILGMGLLALPTGEVVERPERRRRSAAAPALAATESAAPASAAPESGGPASAASIDAPAGGEAPDTSPPDSSDSVTAEATETSDATDTSAADPDAEGGAR